MLDKLYQGHRQVEVCAERLARLLDAAEPDTAALTQARWEIGTRIMQHLGLEDRHLYGNLAASSDPAVAAIGRKYQALYAAYLAEYAEHAKRWSAAAVKAQWTAYRRETREQLRLLAERIALVERELYPLIDRVVDISVAAAPSRSWARDAFAIKASVAPEGS